LVSRFNLLKSVNYTPYLFPKKVEKTALYRDNLFIVCGLWFAPKHFADAKCSSVARWPWPPLSHSNQAVQKICAEKLVAVEVAVSSNKVL
jgi:hypothetical protein